MCQNNFNQLEDIISNLEFISYDVFDVRPQDKKLILIFTLSFY